MNKRNQILTAIFILLSGLNLAGVTLEISILELFTKPLLMPWVIVYFLLNVKKKRRRWLVVLAFLFSWLGDMFLLFSNRLDEELLFYAGVGGFFLAQLSYIIVFLLNAENHIKGLLRRNPLWAIPFILYGIGISYLLYPELDGIMIPFVLTYAASLIGMSMAALNRRDRVGLGSFSLVFTGSVFFLASDSLIAINKFYTDIHHSGLLVMSTYILAQYLIMRGLIDEKEG